MSELCVSKSTIGVGQFEGPKKLVGFLEMGSNSVDFMYQIFDGNNSKFAQVVFNQLVVAQWDSLSVDLGVTSLVNEFTNSLKIWFTICDVWLNQLKHLLSSLGQLDKDTIVDLKQSKKLKNLSWLWCNVRDTT